MRLVSVMIWAAAGLQAAESIHIGALTLRPTAFLDAIGESRSSTTPDSISTKFGNIPLSDTPGESLASVRHSRLMLKGELPAGPVKLSVWLESDFMNFTAGQSPYRWRQYWGQAQIGKWEIMGGLAWSLLRPNRFGTATDTGIMNTDVVEPAFHVGLLGFRVRQVRVARSMGIYKAVVAWEGVGNFLTKIVRDKDKQHLELGGFTGRFGRRGVTASAVLSVAPRIRLVTQQYWSKRAAYQAIGGVPEGVNGVSTLDGAEVQVTKTLEVYSYAGLVYGARAATSGNRLVREWTAGVNRKVALPSLRSGLLMSFQYSHLGRAVWNGKEGVMDYLMYRVRYTFN
jgi:hypothetical protein